MKGIPPEIDALLWQIAEEGTPSARAEFESRHARYGPELARRVRMVSELREAGKTPVRRPAFTPRPKRITPPSRLAVGGALGLAALAIGAIAYVVASSGERPPTVPAPVPVVSTKPLETPKVVYQESPIAPKSPEPQPQEPTPETPKEETPKPSETPKYLVPHDVRIADTSLTSAIQLVAAGGGLNVTIAPGFEDRKVSFSYEGMNTLENLKAMGSEFGFSVLDEEDGHVLVVPARSEAEIRHVGP